MPMFNQSPVSEGRPTIVFSAYNGNLSNQALPTQTTTVLIAALGTVESNTQSAWNASNGRLTPTKEGVYLVTVNTQVAGNAAVAAFVLKNTNETYGGGMGAAASEQIAQCTALVYMNGTTDYLRFAAYVIGTTAINSQSYNARNTQVRVTYLG